MLRPRAPSVVLHASPERSPSRAPPRADVGSLTILHPARAAPVRLLPALPRVSDERASFRLATRARLVLRLPGGVFHTRAARCVRPTSASQRSTTCTRASSASRLASAPRGAALDEGPGVSRHPARFGGSRFFSSSTHHGAFSSPCALRDRTSDVSRHRMRFHRPLSRSMQCAHDRDRLCARAA